MATLEKTESENYEFQMGWTGVKLCKTQKVTTSRIDKNKQLPGGHPIKKLFLIIFKMCKHPQNDGVEKLAQAPDHSQ